MDIIKLKDNQYTEYEDLLLLRDEYKRKQSNYYTLYIHEFGDLITELFKQKVECIKLKKMITFCITKSNHNQIINQSELDQFIALAMDAYNQELEDMIEENNACKDLKEYNAQSLLLVKKTYRRIAKKIHPDVNPSLYEHKEIQDLWLRTTIAYNVLNIDELQEIEVLVNKVMKELNISEEDIHIENIDEKIEKIKEVIEHIKTTDPYMYKYILEDKEAVQNKKDELEKEFNEYKEYAKSLKTTLDQYHIEEGLLS